MSIPRWRRPRVLAGATVALILVVAGVLPAASLLIVNHDIAQPQVIVMLASHEWERLPEAARMARLHRDAVVLLTQPVSLNPYNCYKCPDRKAWLGELGVAADRVVVLPRRARNTYEEALAVRDYVGDRRAARVLVVTSPYHARRAFATFKSVLGASGASVGVQPSPSAAIAPTFWLLHDYDRRYVSYEWTGIVWYALAHHVPPA